MMKKFFLLLLFCLFFKGISSQIVIHPFPKEIAHNDDYSVKVRVPGSVWKELYEYQAQVDMHNVSNTSMVNFDFNGTVEVAVKCNRESAKSARIRPYSLGITPTVKGDSVFFTLNKPCNLSLEVNGDIFRNLHVFTNPLEKNKPQKKAKNVIYIPAGFHTYPNNEMKIPSGKTLYLEGGAVVKANLICDSVNNIKICGRGIVYQPENGLRITFSKNVEVNDLIFVNSAHYTVFGGQSNGIKINNIRSFSSRGWADGIDMMSCTDISVDGVFMRNSDDCVALYGHRWNYYGDCRNVEVKNSTLWADVAHPIFIGTHGNPEKPEVIENVTFFNIDILNQDEPQLNYQGCMAINVSDENLARNIRFENIRIDDIEQGQLVNLRVAFNKKYATAPGRGIENIYFKDITYNGKNAGTSILEGYSAERCIKNIVFENLTINGTLIYDKMKKPGYYQVTDMAKFYSGVYVENLQFISTK
jgi:Endopolygalacturonase